jgi:hypothetical protein
MRENFDSTLDERNDSNLIDSRPEITNKSKK